ncbi:ly6/PLAUR domain-containing protein 5 [Phascolarctos cinereus]|uniref:Ly6/PLAUR domain-containing protein 5 n=1 Tax=Phascolarctos cinereus TaxID=38626 RepID=A0A6P5LMC5_PHACI|nr:ly6/PLAUR domain-containing protein 5 [Phascolarctos cinereus]
MPSPSPPTLSCLSFVSTVTWALECYSFERSFTGPFDLSGLPMPIVACGPGQEACLEAVTSMNTGYRNSLTLVKKGCSYGPGSGEMTSGGDSLPPDYTMVRRCQENLCNRQIESHDSIPNLSTAPDPPELSGTECWACVSTTAEGCELQNAHKIKCHGGQSVCFQGQGFLAIENFTKSVYMRTCQEPTCTFIGAATHWSDNYLKGTCCKGNLCNGISNVSKTVSSHAPSHLALPLLLIIPLLLGV